MSLPQELFTTESIASLSGACGATYVVCNGLQHAFNFNPRWLGLIISLIIAEIGAFFSGGSVTDHVVGILNGFNIYCATVGLTTITHQPENNANEQMVEVKLKQLGTNTEEKVSKRRKFLTPWF